MCLTRMHIHRISKFSYKILIYEQVTLQGTSPKLLIKDTQTWQTSASTQTIKRLFLFFMCVSVCLNVHLYSTFMECCQGPGESFQLPRDWNSTHGCEPTGWWESNLGLGPVVLFISEPSLQPSPKFKLRIHTFWRWGIMHNHLGTFPHTAGWTGD